MNTHKALLSILIATMATTVPAAADDADDQVLKPKVCTGIDLTDSCDVGLPRRCITVPSGSGQVCHVEVNLIAAPDRWMAVPPPLWACNPVTATSSEVTVSCLPTGGPVSVVCLSAAVEVAAMGVGYYTGTAACGELIATCTVVLDLPAIVKQCHDVDGLGSSVASSISCSGSKDTLVAGHHACAFVVVAF